MKITPHEVEQVARLARLALCADEVQRIAGDMDAILGYAAKLNELDTEGIVPLAHAVPLHNAMRDDRVHPNHDRAAILAAAPDERDGCFRVPKVIE